MRVAVAILLAGMCAGAAADEVKIRNITYPPGNVLGVTEGSLVFEMGARRITASMADVQAITLTGQVAYNEAETLLAEGKSVDAACAFERLAESVTAERIKQLSVWRAMAAYEKGGEIGKAVGLWTTFLRQTPSPRLLNLRPKTQAARGSAANTEAITHLEAALKDHAARTAIADTLRSALVDLYTTQGQTDRAMTMLNAISATQAQTSGQHLSAMAGGGSTQVRRARLLMEEKKHAEALQVVQGSLTSLKDEELAGALMLSGKARLALAAQADQAKDARAATKHRVDAGLDFMRISTYWPGVAEAPEAMLLAGDICAALGNTKAADLMYQRIMQKHPGTPSAKQASERLEAMSRRAS